MRGSALFAAILALAASAPAWGCGTDVDIGGTADLSADCEPCARTLDCHATSACAQYAGNAYCATLCPKGTECDATESCTVVTNTSGASVQACLPSSGKCPTAPPPPGPDGSVPTRCGADNGPTIPSACHSCKAGVGTCQANGCYGGWWCNTTTNDCVRPPKCI